MDQELKPQKIASLNQNDPWQTWDNISPIEQDAINAVIRARDLVIASLPAERLVAIYIKGSFVRREMKEGSDVDMVPIVVNNEDQDPVWQVNDADIAPVVVVPLSLWELQHNELSSKSDGEIDLRAKPDALLWDLESGALMQIYGDHLDSRTFSIRTPKQAFIEKIAVVRKGYLPAYREGRIKFYTLLKEVFWLTELEQSVKGLRPIHSFDAIAQSVTDQKHIIHQALELRIHPDQSHEEQFIRGLEQHLTYLQKTIQSVAEALDSQLTTVGTLTFGELANKVTNLPFKHRQMLIAIDGGGGAGKTTFASCLQKAIPGSHIVKIDDFYRPPQLRTPVLSTDEINPNFDWDRLRTLVLDTVRSDKDISYQLYDFEAGTLTGEVIDVPRDATIIVEGVWSIQETFADLYDYCIWLEAPADLRLERGVSRDGEELRQVWVDEWIPIDDSYKKTQQPHLRADLVVDSARSDFQGDHLVILRQ